VRRVIPVLALLVLACAGIGTSEEGDATSPDYFRYAAFDGPLGEAVVSRWEKRKMPLRVHLPPPPVGLYDDADEVYDYVRDGVLDWTDVVEPGVPSFEFVDDVAGADIPFQWDIESTLESQIAYCQSYVQPKTYRFSVESCLVTGRWLGTVASLDQIHAMVLHEMGHALGILGHSPEPQDIMFAIVDAEQDGLSDRDRATLKKLYERPIGSRVAGAR